MKIFVLTTKLSTDNGWGRYSVDLLNAYSAKNTGYELALGLPEPLNYRENYFLAIWYALRLRKYAKDCDVIHAFVEPYSYIAYWLSVLMGKKYYITAHGTFGVLPYSFSSIKKYFHKKSFENAEKIICVSNYTKKRLSEFGLKNLEVINNGIDLKKFCHSNIPLIDEREGIILSVGALKHRKGYHVSIEALANVFSEIKDLKYCIVGSQSDALYFNKLKKMTVDLRIEDRIEFMQDVPDKDLVDLYRKAKLFVLTPVSEGDRFEGFGLVYLEAGACGLPVIGSLDSGAEDAINNGKTGLLVKSNNPSLLSEAILKLFNDRELAQRMSDEGIKQARSHDWEIVATKYREIYGGLKN
jgi:phosphatidylinositol alpha-1,6-mannosyltransferase